MTNILDTVEPDGWADEESLGATSKSVTCQFTAYSTNLTDAMMPIYSRETVESLLEAHRKQVLLEAIKTMEENPANSYGVEPAIAFAIDELRRMAEGEKHE
jgi:hypothetical protein